MPVSLGSTANDNLTFLGHNEVNPFHVMDAEIVGDRAYISNGLGSGLEVYDISDPQNPERIYANGPSAWRCQSYGDTLLAAFVRRSGVQLFDISSGDIPVALGQYDPPGTNEALEGGVLFGDTLICAAHQHGIYLIRIADPFNPQKTGEFSLDSSAAWNIARVDSFIFVANGRFGLSVLGLAGSIREIAHVPLPGLANDINLDDTVAVLSLGPAGLATVNIADPYNPQLLDTIGTDGNLFGSGIAHHLVVSGSWHVMELFDITDPASIVKVGSENTKTWAMGADIRDDSLIVVGDWRGMSCYTVSANQGPDIDVGPEILDFGFVDTPTDTTIVVQNTGSTVLDVSSIDTPSGIAVNPNSFTVPGGGMQMVTITATGTQSLSGFITYNTNDPDESTKTQEIYKNSSNFPHVGSVAPDFTLPGTDGLNHTLSEYRGKVVFLEFGAAW
jgi:hypothetical protein